MVMEMMVMEMMVMEMMARESEGFDENGLGNFVWWLILVPLLFWGSQEQVDSKRLIGFFFN